MSYLIGAGLILTLISSLFIVLTSTAQQNELGRSMPWLSVVFIIMFVFVLVLIPWKFGEISRGVTSPLFWTAYQREYVRHGIMSGLLAAISALIYSLWTFWIFGHLFANYQKTKTGRRPTYPYIINILVGLLLSIENNPVYRLLDRSTL